MSAFRRILTVGTLIALLATAWIQQCQANVCPFCSAVGQTIAEKIDAADVVVIAELIKQPQQDLLANSEDLPKGKFVIKQVIRGEKYVATGDEFETLLVGRYQKGTPFMVIGVDAPTIAWSTPNKVNKQSVEYINEVLKLPKTGGERLKFFQNYLQSEESMLAYDAYDEFARAPYADLIAIKNDLNHDQLIKWIKDPEIPVNRKRLYYTMLGVCGTDKDLALLEDILTSGDRKRQRGLDSLVACYLNLKGKAGLPLIDKHFLKNPEAGYVDVFAIISALRFHGSETDKIKREELVKSMRLVLDRPDIADMVIPDLARWKDWSVAEKLVKIFKNPPKESSSFIRVPIVTYLLACPKPEAKTYIEELRKIDAEAVGRAEKMLQWEMGLDDFDDEDDDGEIETLDFGKKSKDKKDRNKKGSAEESENDGKKSGDRTDVIDVSSSDLEQNPSAATTDNSDITWEQGSDYQPNSAFEGAGALSVAPETKQADSIETSSTDKASAVIPVRIGTSNSDTSESFVSTPAVQTDGQNSPILRSSNSNSNSQRLKSKEIQSTPTNLPGESGVDKSSAKTANPVAAQSWQLTSAIIMIPMTVSIILFVLSWSVLNGWFERLIY